MFFRVGVIVSEQMQDAVDAQQFDLVLGACPCTCACLAAICGHSTTSPSRPGTGSGFVPASHRARATHMWWPQLVHGEREHVSRTWLAHPPLMQVGHRVLVDQQHGQFGEGMDAQPVERMPGQSRERYPR